MVITSTSVKTMMDNKQKVEPLAPDPQSPRWAMWNLTKHWSPCAHRLVQAYFDWVTGYYLQPPLWRSNPWLELAYGLFQYFGGLGIVAMSVLCATWWLLPVGWGLSIAGKAQLQEVVHFCAHEVFCPKIKQEKNREDQRK